MSGGTISGNTASSYGGGVYVSSSSTFTMGGGTISGNIAPAGGGVYVDSSGTFTKQSGGTIYGADASNTLKNSATNGDSYGHAVYVGGGKKRNTTAGFGVTLDSSKSGAEGGWEDASSPIQIDLRPTPNDPSLSNTTLYVYDPAWFSAQGNYNSWTWYRDGQEIGGEHGASYYWPGSGEPGIYELSVVVTTGRGEKLSAGCRITIRAH
jgi:parallel beta-helix repeat protein